MLKYLLKLFACMNNFSIKLERGLCAEHRAVEWRLLCVVRMIVMMLTRDAESRTNLKYLLIIFDMRIFLVRFPLRARPLPQGKKTFVERRYVNG